MKVAVLDTSIDQTHPDLAGRVAEAKNFTTDSSAVDGHGHGTQGGREERLAQGRGHRRAGQHGDPGGHRRLPRQVARRRNGAARRDSPLRAASAVRPPREHRLGATCGAATCW
ncbi:hypothetical protein ACGF0K_08635 [Streptomyces sp. NPDC048156]|uniref:hypothetical protein n=1 Tax=Streptomyces sp. NPDC048156 TaxID=3365502 RepID=UPI00371B6755